MVLGYVDMVCTGLGGGLYERSGSTGCSVVGSTAGTSTLVSSTAGAATVSVGADIIELVRCMDEREVRY